MASCLHVSCPVRALASPTAAGRRAQASCASSPASPASDSSLQPVPCPLLTFCNLSFSSRPQRGVPPASAAPPPPRAPPPRPRPAAGRCPCHPVLAHAHSLRSRRQHPPRSPSHRLPRWWLPWQLPVASLQKTPPGWRHSWQLAALIFWMQCSSTRAQWWASCRPRACLSRRLRPRRCAAPSCFWCRPTVTSPCWLR